MQSFQKYSYPSWRVAHPRRCYANAIANNGRLADPSMIFCRHGGHLLYLRGIDEELIHICIGLTVS